MLFERSEGILGEKKTGVKKNLITKVFPPGKRWKMGEIMPIMLNRTEFSRNFSCLFIAFLFSFKMKYLSSLRNDIQ